MRNLFEQLRPARKAANLSEAVVFAFDPSVYPSLAMAFCRRLLVCYTMPSSTIARASHARCARCGVREPSSTIYKRCD